jgi:hypothetical protein
MWARNIARKICENAVVALKERGELERDIVGVEKYQRGSFFSVPHNVASQMAPDILDAPHIHDSIKN